MFLAMTMVPIRRSRMDCVGVRSLAGAARLLVAARAGLRRAAGQVLQGCYQIGVR